MKILGICHDVLICSACLLVDGEIVAAIAEERLDRVKQSRVFPTLAIDKCLAMGGLSLDDVDEIAVGWNPAIDAETSLSGYLTGRTWRSQHFTQVPTRFLRQSGRAASHAVSQSALWDGAPTITYVDHYLAHIGNAAFLSPFDECAAVILDGRGEKHTGLIATVKGADVDILDTTPFPHSLGLFYGAVTQFLGFRPDSDEWKVMALASFADGDNDFYPKMRELISVDELGRLRMQLDYFQHYNFWDKRMYGDRFVEAFGQPRKRDEPLTSRHEAIAAAMQRVFEEVTQAVLVAAHERTGQKRVVVNGGCFMNSVYNGKLTQTTPFDEVFIGSCPDDSGTAIGAALYLHSLRKKERPRPKVVHNYWGPAFSDAECLETAQQFRLPNAELVADPAKSAASDLVAGKLIGWFQGPMEFGQRALGNRSILVDPRRDDARDIVNSAVKYRESFRPFAPAILAEHVAEWFECEPDMRVPFMERVLPFREDKKKLVPAVVHVDGSGRLQTVDEATSPRFHALIRAFAAETGVPIVLNTSFNLNGEPIVCEPKDAVRTFYSCGLEVLYLGNVRISK